MQKLLLARFSSICLLLCLFTTAAMAQLYPGDANNDGRVNNIDILYIGYAYGTYGPTRVDSTVDYAEVAVPLFWNTQFPDSTNFAFADADGSGIVDFGDFLAVHLNYGNKRANPSVPTFLNGTPGFDPQIRLGSPANIPFVKEGDAIEIPIFLEGPGNNPVRAVNGIAFTLEYDQRFFKELSVDFSESWLGQDSAFFTYQAIGTNRLEIALTRFGIDPKSGRGKIGVVKAIIEDDVIGFLTRDSAFVPIKAQYIKMVDGDFQDIATAGSETIITIYDSEMLVPIKENPLERLIQVFPNPTSSELQIRSPVAMQQVEIFNLQGQVLAQWQLQSTYTLGLSLDNQQPGIVCIRITTDKGTVVRKVLIR